MDIKSIKRNEEQGFIELKSNNQWNTLVQFARNYADDTLSQISKYLFARKLKPTPSSIFTYFGETEDTYLVYTVCVLGTCKYGHHRGFLEAYTTPHLLDIPTPIKLPINLSYLEYVGQDFYEYLDTIDSPKLVEYSVQNPKDLTPFTIGNAINLAIYNLPQNTEIYNLDLVGDWNLITKALSVYNEQDVKIHQLNITTNDNHYWDFSNVDCDSFSFNGDTPIGIVLPNKVSNLSIDIDTPNNDWLKAISIQLGNNSQLQTCYITNVPQSIVGNIPDIFENATSLQNEDDCSIYDIWIKKT